MNYKGFIQTLIDRPLCQATQDTALSLTAFGGWKAIALNQVNIDNGLMYDSTNDRIKVIKAGKYLVNVNTSWFAGNDTGDRRMRVTQTGSAIVTHINGSPISNAYAHMAIIADAVVDDYFQLDMYQTSTATLQIIAEGCIVDVYKLAET